jgi:hypothetical protein
LLTLGAADLPRSYLDGIELEMNTFATELSGCEGPFPLNTKGVHLYRIKYG